MGVVCCMRFVRRFWLAAVLGVVVSPGGLHAGVPDGGTLATGAPSPSTASPLGASVRKKPRFAARRGERKRSRSRKKARLDGGTETTTVAANPLGRIIHVGTAIYPPFALKDEEGAWDGLALDMWRRIAELRGWDYDIVEISREKVTEALLRGEIDVVATGIPMTREREQKYDFTHPYHVAGLGIAVPMRGEASWGDALSRVFSLPFLLALLSLLALVLFFGVLVWLFERGRNKEQFGSSARHGIGTGFWFSAVTMTTVGYGDMAPRTLGGRSVALVWMFLSLFLVSGFTGTVASLLTVNQLESPVRGLKDLSRHRTVTVAHSIASEALKSRKISAREFPTLDDAMSEMLNAKADAVVFEASELRFRASHELAGQVRVLRRTFDRQQYGLALRSQSPLREPINRSILRVLTSREWQEDRRDLVGR